jgi:hypothetical protein
MKGVLLPLLLAVVLMTGCAEVRGVSSQGSSVEAGSAAQPAVQPESASTISPPPQQTSAPAMPARPIVATAELDMTGKAPNDLPGLPLKVGTVLTSLVDTNTKPRDVFAVELGTGQAATVIIQVLRDPTERRTLSLKVLQPGTQSLDARTRALRDIPDIGDSYRVQLLPSGAGTYSVAVSTRDGSVRYKLSIQ